jgi:NAD(P)-dependent dehydrogenase (short-subunit alcohol dehydrogenase family)
MPALPTGSEERRVCLLTGAGGLLGAEFCRSYARRYDIVAVHRNRRPSVPSQLEEFVDPLDPGAHLPENSGRVFAVHSDLTRDGEVERVVELALARFGRVDVLVNNAASMRLHPKGVTDGDAALRDFESIFDINVGIPLRLATRVAQRYWISRDLENRAENRNVVNVSSLSGAHTYPHVGQALYAASKAALNHLTRHLGAEFTAFGVRVNAIAPDSFPGRVPTRRVADAIVRLDEEDVTGKILAVSGAGS